MLIYATQAAVGDWRGAWKGTEKLPETAFTDAGGNGHSLSNSLWYIATRPAGGANSSVVLGEIDKPIPPVLPPGNHPVVPPVKGSQGHVRRDGH